MLRKNIFYAACVFEQSLNQLALWTIGGFALLMFRMQTEVVFLVVCGNFALSGYILFGEQVLDWFLAQQA